MRIINAMFGCGKGGIEQAFLDYDAALHAKQHEVITLVHPRAQILPAIIQTDSTIEMVANYGSWDITAVWKLKQLLQRITPDCIIAHGNRAVTLLRKATNTIPIIGVCHNYNLKHLMHCDGLLSITNNIRDLVISRGFSPSLIHQIPNMITVPTGLNPRASLSFRTPPIIGTMGRFVKKKGINIFIEALSILKARAIPFCAIIGGCGIEDQHLRTQVSTLGLDNDISFTGWVEDKTLFYKNCDIFCLPSLHEPFGIVLLEAFLHALPVVSTDSEGPCEIAHHEHDALIVQKANAVAMADAIERLIMHPKLAASLAINAFSTVTKHYDSAIVSVLLDKAITDIIQQTSNKTVIASPRTAKKL